MNEQLKHHGIIGQKWGVRRYRNYDGTYTEAGLKRYDDASEKLEKRKQEYKDAKSSGVRGDALKLAKSKVKAQKREVDKHYKHLAMDKMADKGKIRYNNGERIRGNDAVENTLMKIGSLSLTAAAYSYKNTGKSNCTAALAIIGAASIGASATAKAVNYAPNNQLRAYYSHTSKY